MSLKSKATIKYYDNCIVALVDSDFCKYYRYLLQKFFFYTASHVPLSYNSCQKRKRGDS